MIPSFNLVCDTVNLNFQYLHTSGGISRDVCQPIETSLFYHGAATSKKFPITIHNQVSFKPTSMHKMATSLLRRLLSPSTTLPLRLSNSTPFIQSLKPTPTSTRTFTTTPSPNATYNQVLRVSLPPISTPPHNPNLTPTRAAASHKKPENPSPQLYPLSTPRQKKASASKSASRNPRNLIRRNGKLLGCD